MNRLLEIKKAKAKQLTDELNAVKTLLDVAPADRQQVHYERAEALLKQLEAVNADLRIMQEGQSERTLAVNGLIPGIVRSNALSQQQAAGSAQEAEYRAAFYATMTGKATPHQRDLVTTATGAAIIPETMFNRIVENAKKQQGLLSYVRILNIPGKLSIPVGEIQTPAAWHVEGAPISDTNAPPQANVTLGGFELAKLFSMSAAMQAMSIEAFEGYLTEELGRCTRDALNAAIFDGTGGTQPTGINTGIVWNATNSKLIFGWEEALEAMAMMPSNFRQGAAFCMNSETLYKWIGTMSDANGNPLFVRDAASGIGDKLLGKQVIIDDFCPDDTAYFLNPLYYAYNFSKPISIERSSEAGFTTGTVLYRSLAVVDGKPLTPLAFVKLTFTA